MVVPVVLGLVGRAVGRIVVGRAVGKVVRIAIPVGRKVAVRAVSEVSIRLAAQIITVDPVAAIEVDIGDFVAIVAEDPSAAGDLVGIKIDKPSLSRLFAS